MIKREVTFLILLSCMLIISGCIETLVGEEKKFPIDTKSLKKSSFEEVFRNKVLKSSEIHYIPAPIHYLGACYWV